MGKRPVSARNDSSKRTTAAPVENEASPPSSVAEPNSSRSESIVTQYQTYSNGSPNRDYNRATSGLWSDFTVFPDESIMGETGASSSSLCDSIFSISTDMLLDDSLNFTNLQNNQASGFHHVHVPRSIKDLPPLAPAPGLLNPSAPFHNKSDSSSHYNHVDAVRPATQADNLSPTKSKTDSDQLPTNQQRTSCVHLASSTLHSLSIPSSFCNNLSATAPLNTVEQVLATNRGATTAFHTLMQCPCSQSSSNALTLALIINKILGCYSAIGRCSLSSSLSSTTNILPPSSSATSNKKVASSLHLSGSSPSLTSLSTPGSPTTGFTSRAASNIVLDSPITIGAIQIDADDEHKFILQLVLSELRKVSKMVDTFAKRYCTGASNRSGEAMMGGGANEPHPNEQWNSDEETIYNSLRLFLRSKVQAVRKEIGVVLRRSEEGAMGFEI